MRDHAVCSMSAENIFVGPSSCLAIFWPLRIIKRLLPSDCIRLSRSSMRVTVCLKLWHLYAPCGCGRPLCEVLIARGRGSDRCDRGSAGRRHSSRDIFEQGSSLHVVDGERTSFILS